MENETAQQRYRRKNREKIAAAMRERRKADPQAARAAEAKWRAENPDKLLDKERRRYSCPKRKAQTATWHKQNRDKLRPGEARRRAEHPEKHRMSNAARRAREAAACIPLSAAHKAEMLAIYHSCPTGYEVDHIIPLHGKRVCGLHVPWNLRHLPAAENRAKSNIFVEELGADR